MPTKKSTSTSPIYQLKVTLKNSRPPIWRRIQVSGDVTLAKLHRILQEVMGWTDSHLHHFFINDVRYAVPHPDDWEETLNEARYKLRDLAEERAKFTYEYDFGDSWEHDILVEKIAPPEPGVHYPVCLKGKGACPPEDCGGIYGYLQLLEALQNPDHPEHDDMLEWIGGEFDPEAFDLDGVNQALRSIR